MRVSGLTIRLRERSRIRPPCNVTVRFATKALLDPDGSMDTGFSQLRPVHSPRPDQSLDRARRPARRWLRHFGFWTLLVLVNSLKREGPVIRGTDISWIESLKIAVSVWYSWALLAPVILWVDRKLPLRKDALVQRFLAHVPLSFVFITAYTYLSHAISVLIETPEQTAWLAGPVVSNALRATTRSSNMIYWVIVAIGVSFEYQRFLRDQEVQQAEIQRLMSEAQLKSLQAQLHPHFLFNTLNAISDYIETDAATARMMLEKLGDLLRSLTHTSADGEVALADELAFVETYLELQTLRFGDSLSVRVDVDPEVLNALVPPLILQPLVENAIKHGRLNSVGVAASIHISAWPEGDRLNLRVSDNGPGFAPNWTKEDARGIGLSNTRQRIQTLYGQGTAALVAANAPGGGAQLDLHLPLRKALQVANA